MKLQPTSYLDKQYFANSSCIQIDYLNNEFEEKIKIQQSKYSSLLLDQEEIYVEEEEQKEEDELEQNMQIMK